MRTRWVFGQTVTFIKISLKAYYCFMISFEKDQQKPEYAWAFTCMQGHIQDFYNGVSISIKLQEYIWN